MSPKKNKNETALAGEFAVLSQLAAAGFNASMTLGNTKEIDILIHHPATNKHARLEVKTARNKIKNSTEFGKVFEWEHMNVKHETMKDEDLFYCFVSLNNDTTPAQFRFFIVPSRVVADYVKKEHKIWMEGRALRGTTRKENPKRSFRLGFQDNTYQIKTAIVDEYENKWELLSHQTITG